MACELEPLLIGKEDFDCIGQVAKHCDWNQLCLFIREQQNLSLLPKIGQCLWNMLLCYKIETECIHASDPDVALMFENLLCGGSYISCDGITKIHFGLNRMLVHYAYGAYIYRHGYVDTPFGVVQKLNQDSVPAPMNELRNIMKEHQNNAEYYWKMTKDYLCTLKDTGPINECFKCSDCECKCNHCKGSKNKSEQNRGIRFNNVSRW